MDKGREVAGKERECGKEEQERVKQGKDEESGKGWKWRRELRQERGN